MTPSSPLSLTAVLVCAAALCTLPATAQFRLQPFVGIDLGLQTLAFDVQAFVAPGVPTTQPLNSVGVQPSIHAGVTLHGGAGWLFGAGLGIASTAASSATTQQRVVASESGTTLAIIERLHDYQDVQVMLSASAGYQWAPQWQVHGLLQVRTFLSQQIQASDRIVQPEGVTFVSTGTNQRTLNDVQPAGGAGATYLAAGVGVRRALFSTSVGEVSAQLSTTYAITSALTAASWHPFSASIGVVVDLGRQSPAERQRVVVKTVTTDTTTVYEPYVPGVEDPWWSRDTIGSDTVLQTDDVAEVTTRIRVTRHMPNGPPFLATVVTASVVKGASGNGDSLEIRSVSTTDFFARQILEIYVDATLKHRDTVLTSEHVRTVALRDLVDISEDGEHMIEVYATTEDTYGFLRRSTPATVIIQTQ